VVRFLVSNVPLPSTKIGSWTNRVSKLLDGYPDFFNYILSPTDNPDSKFIFCKKRKWISLFPNKLRNWQLKNYVCGQFIKGFLKFFDDKSKVQVVVLDDLIILEAFAYLKLSGFNFELVYSFHGHSFVFPGFWSRSVNKVLFLTKLGYLETLSVNNEFTPLVSIVGNGIDSELFYPLSEEKRLERKISLGKSIDKKILIWLSNNRPNKGLFLFEKVVDILLDKYSNLEVIVIGDNKVGEEKDGRVFYLGKIPNNRLADILQIGNFFMFTSLVKEGFGLSLVEAIKCGNIVISSKLGGVEDVLSGLPGVFLIDTPNIIESWISGFDAAWVESSEFTANESVLKGKHDLKIWMNTFIKALS
jgi:glycosyltransferase involved in cell wall biosynthesis